MSRPTKLLIALVVLVLVLVMFTNPHFVAWWNSDPGILGLIKSIYVYSPPFLLFLIWMEVRR